MRCCRTRRRCSGRLRCPLTGSRTASRTGSRTSTTRIRESAHHMLGRPLPRSLCDGPVLVLCIYSFRKPPICNTLSGSGITSRLSGGGEERKIVMNSESSIVRPSMEDQSEWWPIIGVTIAFCGLLACVMADVWCSTRHSVEDEFRPPVVIDVLSGERLHSLSDLETADGKQTKERFLQIREDYSRTMRPISGQSSP